MGLDITQLFAPTLLFALACYFASLGTRSFFQKVRPDLKGNFDWENFILPILPIMYGAGFALIPKYPIPAAFIGSAWSKVFFGGMAGTLSGLIYKVMKAVVKRVFGVDVDENVTAARSVANASLPAPPPPPPEDPVLPEVSNPMPPEGP
jgi:hypothetical protein